MVLLETGDKGQREERFGAQGMEVSSWKMGSRPVLMTSKPGEGLQREGGHSGEGMHNPGRGEHKVRDTGPQSTWSLWMHVCPPLCLLRANPDVVLGGGPLGVKRS